MSIKSNHKIGRGKYYSIAKAGLILYFEDPEYKGRSIDWGQFSAIHAIIDIAGAEHCSFLTSRQVISCLINSPYWGCKCIHGFYSGIGNGKASLCTPSVKGKEYYEKHLKIEI